MRAIAVRVFGPSAARAARLGELPHEALSWGYPPWANNSSCSGTRLGGRSDSASRGLSRPGIEVGENFVDDIPVFDIGNETHRTATPRTGLDINTKHPTESLSPRHRRAPFGWWWRLMLVHWTLATCVPRLAGVTRARYFLLGANTHQGITGSS